jgi:hypothetical protein
MSVLKESVFVSWLLIVSLASLHQSQNVDAPITLSTNTANPTGLSTFGTLTIYLTYTTYDESNIIYG